MKLTDIEGFLLCSECESQLRVKTYSVEFGFFKVYPCKHCERKNILEQYKHPDESTNKEIVEKGKENVKKTSDKESKNNDN